MENRPQLITPREAAQILGIEYQTNKKWILRGKIKTSRTPGGHHRLNRDSLRMFIETHHVRPASRTSEEYRRVSCINQLFGKVASTRILGLIAEVIVVVGETEMMAIISSDAANELCLKKDGVTLFFNAIDVMIGL